MVLGVRAREFKGKSLVSYNEKSDPLVMVQGIRVHLFPPLWKRGARGDFFNVILKSPFNPPLPKGDKDTRY